MKPAPPVTRTVCFISSEGAVGVRALTPRTGVVPRTRARIRPRGRGQRLLRARGPRRGGGRGSALRQEYLRSAAAVFPDHHRGSPTVDISDRRNAKAGEGP